MNIIKFTGGLGNQMFYYALYRKIQRLYGNNSVVANIDFYSKSSVEFELTDVFKKTAEHLSIEANGLEKKYRKYNRIGDVLFRGHIKYLDRLVYGEKEAYVYDEDALDCKESLFDGYWQSYRYFDDIKDEIKRDFSFTIADKSLKDFVKRISESKNTVVSIHIRRGDYLTFSDVYGGICTEEYYSKAINYFKEKYSELTFVFFSNDIDWVKEHMLSDEYECIFVCQDMFDSYEDWYDMYLMSMCNHNIIANSTFSWWGAWLNENTEKIVYAPATWVHTYKAPDICPPQWVRA